MPTETLLFWNAGPKVRLSTAEVARELAFGEEVEGLIDLPIKEIIERLKTEFPQHDEQAGALQAHGGVGTFEATWTWQFLKVECRDLPSADRQRLIDAVESLGCMAYAPGGA